MYMTAHQLQEAMDKGKADWIARRSDIDKRIVHSVAERSADGRSMFVTLTLDNGYAVTGSAFCADADQVSVDVAETVAHDRAMQQLQPLFDFLAAEKKFWFESQLRVASALGEADDGR